MKRTFDKNENLGIIEEVVFNHFYNADIDMLERGGFRIEFIVIVTILILFVGFML